MNNEISKNKVLIWVAGLAVANAVITNLLAFMIGDKLAMISFTLGRIVLAAWGGWYIVFKAKSNLWYAALIGFIIMLTDHVILKGGLFLLTQMFWPDSIEGDVNMAFIGVIASFVMFSPIAAIISLCGGFVGRKYAMNR